MMDLTQCILSVDHANSHRVMYDNAEGEGFFSLTAGREIIGSIVCVSDTIALRRMR